MKNEIKTAIILGVIISAFVGSLSFAFSIIETQSSPQISDSDLQKQTIDKSGFKKAPNLVGIADYINTTPEELEKEIQGKVVMYDIDRKSVV